MKSGVPHSFEDYFPNLDRYFRFTSVPLGEYFITTGTDITAIKKAEMALRSSEERLRLLGDNLPNSIVYLYTHESDDTPRFLYVSAGVERLNGVKAEDVLRDAGVLHRQFLPGELPGLLEAEKASARDLSVFDREVQMRLPDGQLRWMHLRSRPRRLSDGRVVWDGVQTDITERKQAESALQATLQRFYVILSGMHAAVLLVTDDGRVEFANQAFCDRFGLKDAPADLVGLTPGDMIEKIKNGYRHPDEAVVRIREILDRGQPVMGEELAMQRRADMPEGFRPLERRWKVVRPAMASHGHHRARAGRGDVARTPKQSRLRLLS